MHVSVLRVINYLFLNHLLCQKLPLNLCFQMWGAAPTSVGKNKNYVSFVDDYSKFTWIFLLKHKSEFFAKFHICQQHIERLLNSKILSMQTDWGREYQKLSPFFSGVGISH
jgi:hypothetical protein